MAEERRRSSANGGFSQPAAEKELKATLPEPVVAALTAVARERGLTELLTERLIEIAAGLRRHEIATKNSMSVNTVKAQIRRLFSRLGVSGSNEVRRAVVAAVRRARDGASEEELAAFFTLRFE